jgi:hypothetical protein
MAWLPDTNAWIGYLKNPGGRIRAALATAPGICRAPRWVNTDTGC